jgi:predicted PurR-regulated permease PerM
MTNVPDPNRSPVPVTSDWGSRSHLQTLVLLVATGLGIFLCYRLVLPFVTALAWALALAVVFAPFQGWVESKVKHPNLAALISVLVVGLGVFALASFVGQRLAREASFGADIIKLKLESGEWRSAVESHPFLVPLADWIEQQNLAAIIKTIVTWMTTTGASFVKGSLMEMIGLLVTFYLLFFFLRDRHAALLWVRSIAPLSVAEMDRLYLRVADTIYATIYGTLAIAGVQGLLGGLMFWWLGLSAPLLWGVVMALLAVVPLLGAFIVWIPAALFLALEGSWGKALILVVWGGAIVGTIDNLLRPILVGQRLKLHTVFAFMSVVGGLMLFGPAGLVLGPAVLTVTNVLLEIWRSRFAAESDAPPNPELSEP